MTRIFVRANEALRLSLIAAVIAVVLHPVGAFAVNPSEMLPDPAQEARARALSAELRCMVCQNQSIDDSNADLARDLRLLVRRRIEAGDTDQAVLNYIVSRYGEFVLLKPRFEAKTILLWGAPGILTIAGVAAILTSLRRRQARYEAEPLTDDEKRHMDELLKDI
ncbi:cytochrome c-type biogenesis protein [Oryzifoliimicrobium ureilyticus]|uniref:cytochrome c-type biogenesis protein n=1 Tax=Oryzifoliimicrobium ureilyticus TaxID=3113724 RepID=UPI0030764E1D